MSNTREIKFRAWVEPGSRFVEGMHDWQFITETIDLECGYRKSLLQTGVDSHISGVNLMQYTGLKDKNGVEIYEGDVVEVDGVLNEVYWQGQHAGFWVREVPKQTEFYKSLNMIYISSQGEVIGNIYENPDLLRAGDA